MGLDTAIALATLAEARSHCRVDASDTTFDGDLENLINAVSVMFNTITRRQLLSKANTEYYDGDGTGTLYLNNYPVTTLTSLNIDTDRQYGSETLVISGDYLLYSELGKIVLPYDAFDKGPQTVKVVYTAGYAFASIPYDLKASCLDQIKFQFNRWMKNREGVLAANLEGQSVTLVEVKDLLPSVKMVLDKYVRFGHGA